LLNNEAFFLYLRGENLSRLLENKLRAVSVGLWMLKGVLLMANHGVGGVERRNEIVLNILNVSVKLFLKDLSLLVACKVLVLIALVP
jgi:hypothetical protein